jgi:Kef-type K+ transport system membrane component KefB
VAIAFFGTITAHLAMYATSAALLPRVPVAWKATFMLTNLNVWWSLSAFIVVCCTLEDLNLLSSKLGRLVMSATLIGDFTNFSIAGVTSYLLTSIPSEKIQSARPVLGADGRGRHAACAGEAARASSTSASSAT